jgi:hypothetical protein
VGKAVGASHCQSMVRSLLCAAVAARPDIAHAVGAVAGFWSGPCGAHLAAVGRIFRYLKGTAEFGLRFAKSDGRELVGCSGSGWAGGVDDHHSEAGCVALGWATQGAVWLGRFLSGLVPAGVAGSAVVVDDGRGTVAVAGDPVAHARTGRVDVCCHYVRGAVREGTVVLQCCSAEAMAAGILAGSLTGNRFERRWDSQPAD